MSQQTELIKLLPTAIGLKTEVFYLCVEYTKDHTIVKYKRNSDGESILTGNIRVAEDIDLLANTFDMNKFTLYKDNNIMMYDDLYDSIAEYIIQENSLYNTTN